MFCAFAAAGMVARVASLLMASRRPVKTRCQHETGLGNCRCRKRMIMSVNWRKAQEKAANTARWAVTMTKVRIRKVLARTRWQLVTFCGAAVGESVDIVDLLAVRKDHGAPAVGMKKGDALHVILIQVKGGGSAMPTADDAKRLRAVARRHRARRVLLATWRKGTAARFFALRSRINGDARDWVEVTDLDAVFR